MLTKRLSAARPLPSGTGQPREQPRTAVPLVSRAGRPLPLVVERHPRPSIWREGFSAAMIPTLLDAKTQNGMAIPNAAITNPPSAGPAARPILKATPLAAVALSRSCLGTSIGIVAPHAGEVRVPPMPSGNVVASRSEGVASFRETRPAKTTDTARIATSRPQ